MIPSPQDIKKELQVKKNIIPILPSKLSINSLLSIGGQGVVFRGQASGQDAAVKIYFPGDNLQRRVDREINALQTLQCPSIVRLIWNGEINYKNYLLPIVATEFIEGNCLSPLIQKTPLSYDDLIILAQDVAIAIRDMWKLRIVHRDINPKNILVRPNKRACVIDLGIARHVDRSAITSVGFGWGTLGYMSPEQLSGEPQLTCKTDMFALGVSLVECCEGRHPSQYDQQRLLASNFHLSLPGNISKWKYASVVMKMLHPLPTKRPMPDEIINNIK